MGVLDKAHILHGRIITGDLSGVYFFVLFLRESASPSQKLS